MDEQLRQEDEARADAACARKSHTLYTTRPGCQTCDMARHRRNARARARNQAMRDLGLVRTRFGGWE